MLNQELLSILACPACDNRPPVVLNEKQDGLLCGQCGRLYPVRDDIPVMLIDEALINDQKTASEAEGKKN